MKKRIFLFFLLLQLFASPQLVAANTDSALYDKGAVNPRVPPKETIDDYLADSDFAYARPASTQTNWLSKLINWFDGLIKWIREALGLDDAENVETVISIILYIIIALAAVGILYFIFKNEISFIWGKGGGTSPQTLDTGMIDLSKDATTLLDLLQKAIDAKNYAEAIRIYYTLTLKNLSEKGQINFRIDKTNNEYLFELPEGQARGPFKQLTYYFEYIFYGKFDATETTFLKMQEAYHQLYPNNKKTTTR